MKKFLKVLSILLVICLSLSSLLACVNDGDETPTHTHAFLSVKYDIQKHWKECECGKIKNEQEHVLVDGKCDCGYEGANGGNNSGGNQGGNGGGTTEHTHSYAELKYNAIEHWYECICGDKKDVEQHAFNAQDKCDCGYEKPAPDHVCAFDELKFNENSHWYECTCGEQNANEGHKGGTATCEQKAVCIICGQSYGEVKEHDYAELKHNDTEHWYECDCGAQKLNEEHNGGEATCKAQAICAVCGIGYGVLSGHVYESGKCKWCGDKEQTAEETYERVGDIIYFGSYPQAEVTDSATTSALLTTAGDPQNSTSGWTSYNYYVSGSQTDCMYYKDITYGEEKYRGVYIKKYRPTNTTGSGSVYYVNSLYWFKYELIEWDIVKEESGYVTIVCNMALDKQAYQDTYFNGYNNSVGTPSGTYANNYKYSTIRKWLNDTFYQTAFNSLQQAIIQTVEVNNSASSTRDLYNNPYLCENTFDKVWILSHSEAFEYFSNGKIREKACTDYAESQGGSYESGGIRDSSSWWIRTPLDSNSSRARTAYDKDHIDYSIINSINIGVVPVLQIKL